MRKQLADMKLNMLVYKKAPNKIRGFLTFKNINYQCLKLNLQEVRQRAQL